MISSMTGFARDAGSLNGTNWAWEVKSVNGRNLDVRVRVPPGLDSIAEDARKLATGHLTRGAVQIGLTLQRQEIKRNSVRINTEVLTSLASALASLPADLPFKPATMDGLLQVRGVVEIDDQEDHGPGEELQAELVTAAARAIKALVEARRLEGNALHDVLSQQLVAMRRLLDSFEGHPARSTEATVERLKGQVSALLNGHAALDDARLYQEAALLATRADVREELDRLSAHIDAARKLLGEGGAIGRKLDFLAQEFGREASTLCAKANHVDLSRLGLDMRTLVDQFREQVQNVE